MHRAQRLVTPPGCLLKVRRNCLPTAVPIVFSPLVRETALPQTIKLPEQLIKSFPDRPFQTTGSPSSRNPIRTSTWKVDRPTTSIILYVLSGIRLSFA
jgi:hypothetical protein